VAIHFRIQTEDPQTEDLLLWLKDRYDNNWVRKAALLRSALSWLELRAPHGSLGTEDSIVSLRIGPKDNLSDSSEA